ncbi:MAG: hypothetical protein GY737_11325 [Desulfobacteraceae bacterium]|nr:hypothetical protein [Desulfobacteraceae bacterium]
MPFVRIQREIKQGTLCWADYWDIDLAVVCPDRVPLNQASPFFVFMAWSPARADGEVLLSMISRTGTGGRISFDEDGGETTKTILGDTEELVGIYGQSLTTGAEPDVVLEIRVNGDVRGTYPMSVGDVDATVEIHGPDGRSEPPGWIPLNIPVGFSASTSPEAGGEYRWYSLNTSALEIADGENEQAVEIMARAAPVSSRWLFVGFTPEQEGQPAVYGIHKLNVPDTEGVTSNWYKNLEAVENREVRNGEVVEIYSIVNNNAYRLGPLTNVRVCILTVNGEEEHILSLLGPGVAGLSPSVSAQPQRMNFLQLARDDSLADNVNEFRALHRADLHEQALIVEQAGGDADRFTYHVLVWWHAQTRPGQDRSRYRFIITFSDRLQGESGTPLQMVSTPVAPVEVLPRALLDITGRLIDAHPLTPGVANMEPLDDVEIRGGGRSTKTSLFSAAHITQARRLMEKLRDGVNPVSQYLAGRFYPHVRRMVLAYDSSEEPSAQLIHMVVDGLNRILQGELIYQADRFTGFNIPDDLMTKIDGKPRFEELTRVNRRLLEIAYAGEITTADIGTFRLRGYFVFDAQNLEIQRDGIETTRLDVVLEGDARGPVTIVVHNSAADVDIARVVHPGAVTDTPINVAVPDVAVVVHKIRGRVFWPDTRVLDNANYHGTPLKGKRVYGLLLEDGGIDPQRPATSAQWADLKNKARVRPSGRPGRFLHRETTDYDGAFEIKYLNLNVGTRFFIWAETVDPATHEETPDYTVRTFYRELLTLTGGNRNNTDDRGKHLIDHRYNISRDAITWGVECVKVVHRRLDDGGNESWVIKPRHDQKPVFAGLNLVLDPNTVERVPYDPDQRLVTGFYLHCLPIVPIHETPDLQSEKNTDAGTRLLTAMDAVFPRGYYADEVGFVLDAGRILSAIDLSANRGHAHNPDNIAWAGNWDAGNVNASSQRRRCELLEKTLLVTPQIPGTYLFNITDARWDFDVVSLADFAQITIPRPPPLNQAVFNNRSMTGDWVPVFHSVVPKLLGLALGRHIILAPGHGFFDTNPPSNDTNAHMARWGSTQGSWNLEAGEDHNNGFMAMEVSRILRRNGAKVTSVREDRDFTRPGVLHPGNNVFNVSANPDFLRLWQQNPIYYFGIEWNVPVNTAGDAGLMASVNNVFVNNPALGQIGGGSHNNKAIDMRPFFASENASSATPVDLYLSIHTNALAGGRGLSVFYLDIENWVGNGEFNTFGRAFARVLRTRLLDSCHLHPRWADVSVYGDFPGGVREVRDTVDYRYRIDPANPNDSRAWTRVRQNPGVAGWSHMVFPRTIPVALVEVGAHDNAEDALLLKKAWFRRLAGEAMAFAVEEQLGSTPHPTNPDQTHPVTNNVTGPASPPAVTRAEMKVLLGGAFGPTPAVNGLVANNNAITTAQAEDYIRDCTGVAGARPANNRLNAIVAEIETVQLQYTREAFVTALRDALVHVARITAADDIEPFVTKAILNGEELANLSRRNRPITRSEAGSFIAAAFGWTPVGLQTVIDTAIGPGPLMALLDGQLHGDKLLPRVEAEAIIALIRALNPDDIFRIHKLYPVDEDDQPLARGTAENTYVLRSGVRIKLVAAPLGIAWAVEDQGIRFSVTKPDRTVQALAMAAQTREKITCEPWEFDLIHGDSTPRVFALNIEVIHATEADTRLTHTQNITVFHLL